MESTIQNALTSQGLTWDGGTADVVGSCHPTLSGSAMGMGLGGIVGGDGGSHGAVEEGVLHRSVLSEQDEALLFEVKAGNEDAARTMVERLYPLILRVVRSHLPRRTLEEDLVQAVFAKVFKALSQFSGLVPLEHWVSRIAVNTCLNQLKHESIRPEWRMGDLSEEEEAVIQHLASTEDEVLDHHRGAAADLLATLLACLKPEERLVITLLHLEERSVEEIRGLTGWSASLVKVKAFRARKRMRALCEELGITPEW